MRLGQLVALLLLPPCLLLIGRCQGGGTALACCIASFRSTSALLGVRTTKPRGTSVVRAFGARALAAAPVNAIHHAMHSMQG